MEKDILSKISQGKWIAQVKLSDLSTEHPRYSIGIEGGKAFVTIEAENGLKNAELIANAPETLKQRDELLEACKMLLSGLSNSNTDAEDEICCAEKLANKAIASVEESK